MIVFPLRSPLYADCRTYACFALYRWCDLHRFPKVVTTVVSSVGALPMIDIVARSTPMDTIAS